MTSHCQNSSRVFHRTETLRLSEVAREYDLTVVQDGVFANLGFLRTQEDRLLVAMYAEAYLDQFFAELTHISAAIVTPQLLARVADGVPEDFGLATAADPLAAFYALHCDLFTRGFYFRHRPTEIGEGARIHPTAVIAPSGVRIGRNAEIGAHVVIDERTVIGDDCVIRHGTVLSTEGFEVRQVRGRRIVVPHAGGVEVGNDVQLQARTCVSRSIWGGATRIGHSTKVDNLVHIAHGAAIGQRCLLASCASIAGTTRIGDDVWIGPNATLSNGLYIGPRSRVGLGMTLARDLPEDGRYPPQITRR